MWLMLDMIHTTIRLYDYTTIRHPYDHPTIHSTIHTTIQHSLFNTHFSTLTSQHALFTRFSCSIFGRATPTKQLSKREQDNKDKQERAKSQRKDDNEMKKALQKIENEHNVARHQKELELQAEIAKAKNNASDRAQLDIQLKAILGKHEQAKKEAENMFKFDKVTKKNKLEARLKKKREAIEARNRAKRDGQLKQNNTHGTHGTHGTHLTEEEHTEKKRRRKNMTEIETAQLARQAELKQEYDNLQKELKSMKNVGKESMAGAGEAAKEFLANEQKRLEKRKRNLEVQLKTIIEHHDASKDTLTKMLNAKKGNVHQRVLERRARKKERYGLGGLNWGLSGGGWRMWPLMFFVFVWCCVWCAFSHACVCVMCCGVYCDV